MKVKDIMTKDPIVMELPGTRKHLLKQLVTSRKTGFPVVKKGTKEYVGFVRRLDLTNNPEQGQLALLVNKEHPSVSTKKSVEAIAELMITKNIYHLPVVEKGKVIGIITPPDFLKVIADGEYVEPVENYVRRECVPIFEGTPLPVVSAVFRVSKVTASPVLNEEGRLSGIITDRDLFGQSFIDEKVAIANLGIGEDEDAWTWEGLRNVMKLYYETSNVALPPKPVKEVMVEDPATLFRKTSVSEAARIMYKYDYGQMPLRNTGGYLIGMISDIDLLGVLLSQ